MKTAVKIDDGACSLCGSPLKHSAADIVIGNLRLHAGTVTKGHMSVTITALQFKILCAYARRANKAVSRDSVMLMTYNDADVQPNDKIIDTVVHHLRAVLGPDSFETRWGGIRIFRPERVNLNPDKAISAADPIGRDYRYWNAADDAKLLDLIGKGMRDSAIAKEMGRTTQSVRDRRRLRHGRRHARGFNGGPNPYWTADEDDALRSMFAAEETDRAIALALQRTPQAIASRRERLGLTRAPGWHWRRRKTP